MPEIFSGCKINAVKDALLSGNKTHRVTLQLTVTQISPFDS